MSDVTDRGGGADAPTLQRRRRRPVSAVTDVPRWAAWVAIGGFALLLTLVILGPLMTNTNYGVQSRIRGIGYPFILLLAIVATRPWKRPERLLVIPWPLLLALGWCWLSIGWAIAPEVGVRRLLLTTMVLWSVFALVRQLGIERSVLMVRVALVVTLAVNYATVLVDPATGIQGMEEGMEGGGWRGIMSQKNYAGLTTALAILFFAFDRQKMHPAISGVVIAAGAVFLYWSDSETSQIMCIVALVFGLLFELLARTRGQAPLAPPNAAWILLVLLAGLALHIAFVPETYYAMLSDPGGFTGRTQIWTALIKAYVQDPLQGSGYGSFWDLGPDGPIFQVASGWVTEISQGHNGYLDLLVQIGLPGTLVVMFAVLVWPLQRLLRGGTHPVRPLAAATLLFCLGHNFTESMLFDRDALSHVFLLIALALLWTATAPAIGERSTPMRPSLAR